MRPPAFPVRRFGVVLVACLVAIPAAAQVLPSLPLPNCVANGMTINATDLCEGTVTGYPPNIAPAGVPRPPHTAVALTVSAREVDFRRDEDRPGPQLVTLGLVHPGVQTGGGFMSTLRFGWPEALEDGIFVTGRHAGSMFWSSGTGGAPYGNLPNPAPALLVRNGPCALNQATCTYRVTWGPYPHPAIDLAHVYRVCLDWDLNWVHEGATGGDQCGTDPVQGCTAGGGLSCVTFHVAPPPPTVAVAKSTRIGSKQFRFDASESGPDDQITGYAWRVQIVGANPPAKEFTDVAFDLDFNQWLIPPTFIGQGVADLRVFDRWGRTKSTIAPYNFAAGVPGPLEITSFTLQGIVNGVATYQAVVKNVSDQDEAIDYVFLEGLRFPAAAVPVTPKTVETLDPGESVEFTVTVPVEATGQTTISVTAYGNGPDGPVKSASKSDFLGEPPPPGGELTTLTDPAEPGDDFVNVGDTSGLRPGNYVGIGPGFVGGDLRRIRRIGAPRAKGGSLVFDVPLANPHPAGHPVFLLDPPPLDDTTPPTIEVTSPTPNAIVCSGAPLTAAFTCSDGGDGVGVETCGDPLANGAALDTSTPGPKQVVLRAWDWNGNLAEKTIAWTVAFCGAEIDSFHCHQAKPGAGTKFTPVAGVRAAGPVDDVLVDLKKPLQLCLPADTSGDGIGDRQAHLASYAVKPQKGQPKIVPQTGVRLASQLGLLAVDTGKLASLLLPTAQDPQTPPAPISDPDLDRFACYGAKLAKGEPKLAKDLQITVADDLALTPLRYALKKLASLCVPVTADGGAPKHPDRLLCFKAARTKGRCVDAAPVNAGGGCKKEVDCGGTKGETAYCATQPKFAKTLGLRVANDLDGGTLDAQKDDVVCLPAAVSP